MATERSTRARRPAKPVTPESTPALALADGDPLPGGQGLARILNAAAARYVRIGEGSGNRLAALTFAAIVSVQSTLAYMLSIWSTPQGERLRTLAFDFGDARDPNRRPPAPSWLSDLRVQVDDITAAGLDATAPPSKRTLGRSEARSQILEAAKKCRAIFTLAGLDPKDGPK